MAADPGIGAERRFRREAQRWDRTYVDTGPIVARLWDHLTRQNVRRRFRRTFEAAGDLTGRSVLDLGCGSGRYLIEAAERGASRVLGVDIAPEMIAIARDLAASCSVGDRIELRCADLAELKLEESFDLVIANGLFDYLPDAGRGLRQGAAWTSGLFVASFPDRWAPRALPRALYWRTRRLRIHLFDRHRIARLAREAGFRSFEIEKIGPIFLLLARPA